MISREDANMTKTNMADMGNLWEGKHEVVLFYLMIIAVFLCVNFYIRHGQILLLKGMY